MKTHEIKEFRKTYVDYDKECVSDGYALAVLYEEKDLVKKAGAHWDKERRIWWMPWKRAEEKYSEDHDYSTLKWLNIGNMVVGQYGAIKVDKIEEVSNTNIKTWELMKNNHIVTVSLYEDFDVVRFDSLSPTEKDWVTLQEARDVWDSLIKGGWNKVEGVSVTAVA